MRDTETLTLTGDDVADMALHWLETPVQGYLGQDYGQSLNSVLMTPQAAHLADMQVAKLRRDVPVIGFGSGDVDLLLITRGPDQFEIGLKISDRVVTAKVKG